MGSNISGTYFTSIEYDIPNQKYNLGPIVVVDTSNNSVVVDGFTMQAAMITTTQVIWAENDNNPSNGILTFVESNGVMTFFGYYYPAGTGQPSTENLFGFNTQSNTPLSNWNGTYYTTEKEGENSTSLANIVVSGSTITYGSATIKNPIYTGYEDSNELAWYTSDGNSDNVAISFVASTSDPGTLLFWGWIWDGDIRPEANQADFFGTTSSEQDAAEVAQDVGVAVGAVVGLAAIGNRLANAAKAAEQDGAAEVGEQDANAGDAGANEADADADAAGDAAADADAGADVGEEILATAEDIGEGLLEGLALLAALGTSRRIDVDAEPEMTKAKSGLSAQGLLRLKHN